MGRSAIFGREGPWTGRIREGSDGQASKLLLSTGGKYRLSDEQNHDATSERNIREYFVSS